MNLLLQQIYEQRLEKYRRSISAILAEIVDAEPNGAIREMLQYALGTGRRFRPLLFLLVYKVLGKDIDRNAYELAAAIELLHKASLLHDDLVDRDTYRRSLPTFHVRYGMSQTVIMGDYLVAEASLRFSRASHAELVDLWLDQYRKLCYGELLDVLDTADGVDDLQRVDAIVYGKTASFLEFVCLTAAITAGATESQQRCLATFGKEIGYLFQIVNDWNNWSGLEEKVGRSSGRDVEHGKVNHISLLLANGWTSKEDIAAQVTLLIDRHAAAAEAALVELDIRNNYTAVLRQILEDRYDVWYWMDPNTA